MLSCANQLDLPKIFRMLKYFIYTRKSTDREDRQVQSIADQRGVLLEIAERRNLHIENIFEESASAKDPGRPIFNQMLKRIEKGEANGILCWKLNRLTRNLADAGRIGQALQDEIIQHIITVDREFLPADNVLVMQFEFGEATQYIRNLRTDVKRGMLRRLKEGYYPYMAPMGYINDRNTRTIIPDPERFELVKKMWDLMLTGKYTPPKICQIANEKWGFRTPANRKIGDIPLTNNGLYSIFSSPFYAGVMRVSGTEYPGKHKPMITLSDFERVQYLLGRKDKPRCTPKYDFAYTGIFSCGECGCAITAQQKRKINKSNGKIRLYTYYHCTHNSKAGRNCGQRKNLRQEEIEKQIADFLDGFKLSESTVKLVLDYLREWNSQEAKTQESLHFSHEQQIALKRRKLSNLIDIRCRDLISDADFME